MVLDKDPAAHGGMVLQTARRLGVRPEDILDFSNNAESAVAGLTAALVAATPYPFAYYPDSACTQLCAAIATHENVRPAQVLAGNGSSELIHLALATLAPRRVLIVAPIFSEYVVACQRLKIEHELYCLDAAGHFRLTPRDAEIIIEKDFDLLILCSPNNPGSVAYRGLDRLFHSLSGLSSPRTVLLDSAYREFLYGTPDYVAHGYAELAASCLGYSGLRLVMLMSFTKYFYCPGVRLGYCLSDAATIEALRLRQPPWMVSRFAELLGLGFLRELEAYRALHRTLPARRSAFVASLAATGVFATLHPPELNFILAQLRPDLPASTLFERLAGQGVLLRVCDNIPGMPPGYVRLQVKSEEENARLVGALRGLERLGG